MNIYDIAKSATTSNSLRNGRDKLTMHDLIDTYPNGIHITEFEMCSGKRAGTEYAVFTFAEDPTKFANAGTVLTTVLAKLAVGCDGIKAANEALKASNGLHVILTPKTSKEGTEYVAVEVEEE